jgi:hypothetical protein
MPYKFPQNIFECIRVERQDYLYNTIEIVPGYTFNQNLNIQKIHKYYNSHYNDGDYETINGIMRKKVFWNLGKRRATISTKQIDIDTKDFLLLSENQATEWNVHLLEKRLKVWMKQSKYSQILNQIADELPVYGSVILRKTKEGAELADLRYTFLEQSATSLKKSRYLIFKHLMTPETMREMEGTWNNVREAIDKFAVTSTKSYENAGQVNIEHTTPELEVYERFGEVPRSFFENDGTIVGDGSDADEDYVYGRWIVAGVDNMTTIATINPAQQIHAPGIILFKEQLKKKDSPFKEVHYRQTKGRWQGIGIIEDTFEDQRMVNKTKDQEDKAQELASLILFQTATDMTARNVLTDVDNGEILKATSPLNRLDNANRALPEMQKVADAYELHADLETFSADLLGGQQTPASTTLGAVKTQLQASSSVYEYKKENFGLFLKDFINDLVFPEFEKEITEKHSFRYTGDLFEMQNIRERVVNGYIRTKIFKGEMPIPTQEEYQQLMTDWVKLYSKQGSKMWIEVEKDFFRNLDYEVSLEITGESKNVQQWLSNLQTVFGLVTQNPLILQNPLYKRLFYKMLTAMGMSVSELENAEAEVTQDMIDTMVRLGTKRTMTTRVNVDDKAGQFAQPVLERGGMIPTPPQQTNPNNPIQK